MTKLYKTRPIDRLGRLAIIAMSPREIEALGEVLSAMEAVSTDAAEFARLEDEFHRHIARGTGNPLIVGNPALDHGQIAITDGSGQFSLTLPYATETHPSSPEPYWTILFPDGQMVSGVVPSAAGPLLIDDLIESHGWAWSSSIYVVPVSPGAKARGVASFTGSSARVSILFSPSFASAPAEITIASSIDANTGEPMSVSCDLVTTTGFDLVAKDAAYVGSVYWTASV